MAAKPSTKKTARNTAPGRPFAQGNDPRRGVGKKGRSGRKPDWLKDWCDDLLARPETKRQVEKILGNADHPAFKALWQAVANRAHGLPKQSVELSGAVTLEQILAKSRE